MYYSCCQKSNNRIIILFELKIESDGLAFYKMEKKRLKNSNGKGNSIFKAEKKNVLGKFINMDIKTSVIIPKKHENIT